MVCPLINRQLFFRVLTSIKFQFPIQLRFNGPNFIMPKRKTTKPSSNDDSTSNKKLKTKSIDSAQVNQTCESDSDINKSANGKTFNLKIISWNVNGVRAALKNSAFDYLKSEPCDILCLQETKCSNQKFPDDLNEWDEYPFKYFSTSAQDGYAGVALFSKQKPILVEYGLNKKKHDEEGRVITAHYDQFILVNAYVPNAGRGLKRLDYRMEWDNDFRNYLKSLDSKKPIVLSGDLNVAHKEIDLENPKANVKNAGFTPEERQNFTELLNVGLIDSYRMMYPDLRRSYTFWSYMRNARAKNIGWRLDYFVVSERLADNICDNQIRQEVLGSDHCPIVLYLAL